jgi:membrane protein YqaA with SNARE-associated domain
VSETQALIALAISAFTSATILPGTSELGLVAFLKSFPASVWLAVAVATAANTAGGLTSYALGRILPQRAQTLSERTKHLIHTYGASALLLSWVPIIGDALCVAAGWMRVNPWSSAVAMALGKAARYAAIVYGVGAVAP